MMTPAEVKSILDAEPRLAAMAQDGCGVTVEELEGRARVSLTAPCAVKLMKCTVYAKSALPVESTWMFKQRSTGLFVAHLSVN